MFINCKLDDVLEFIAHYVKKLTKHFTKASANELPYEVWEPLLGLCNELHDYFDTFNDKQTQTLNSLIEQLQTIKANAYSAETIADYLEQEGSQSTEEVVGLGETFNMALYLYNRNFQKKPNQRTANQRRQIKAPSSLKY